MSVMPTDRLRVCRFKRLRTVNPNRSPFTGTAQRYGLQDWRWQASYEYAPMQRLPAQPVLAALAMGRISRESAIAGVREGVRGNRNFLR